MKEIDFLPEWYTANRKRRVSYHTQFAVMFGIVAIMGAWGFYTARCVSNAQAQVEMTTTGQLTYEQAAAEYQMLEREMADLNIQSAVFSSLESKLPLSQVLAEISFLVDSHIVLTDVQIEAHQFENTQNASGPVRVVRASQNRTVQGDAYFKCTIMGLASDTGDVAKLIRKLEDSPYFDQVIPGFSRTKLVKDREVTEFEIGCTVSNFRQVRK
jgi:Tfp pilus assembly protein PilN